MPLTHNKRMKTSKQLLALVAAAAITGCSEEQTPAQHVNGQHTMIMAASAGHNGARTRTTVGGIADDGHLVMQWEAGDKIGVFGTATTNAEFTSTNTSAANEAAFGGSVNTGDTELKAYYPYTQGLTDLNAIPATIPVEQHYADEQSTAAYDIKAAAQSTLLADGNYRMQFRQMATLLRLQINLRDAEGLAVDEKLQKIEMTCTGSNLTGSYTYSLDNLDAGLTAVSPQPTLTVNMTNQPALGQTVTAYAVTAPGQYSGQTARFVITTDKHTVTFSTNLLTDFNAGTFYDLPLNGTVLSNNNAVVEEIKPVDPENPPLPGADEETANCYMITTTGRHSFWATQIGNGDKGIINGAGFHVTSTAIAPKSAKLLWQDTENFVQDISLQADGKVHYTANKNTGNAVIAVYSGENCTGDILWSWHIWGVGDTLPADEEYTNMAGAKFTVMDRTLGALGLHSYQATLYQWGRKDPVPNSKTYYINGAATNIETSYPVLNDDNATLLTAVQHPGELVKCGTDGDWLATANEMLWGDLNKNDQYTWYSSGKYSNAEAGAGWSNQKTIYDPSPVGYRIANKFTFTGFAVRTSGDTPQGNSTTKFEWINYAKYENGWYFKKNANDTDGSYYPMTGSRGATTGDLWVRGNAPYLTVNYTASYWTSAAQKNAGQSHQFSMAPYSSENTSGSYNSYNAINTVDFASRNNAFAVRCVREH